MLNSILSELKAVSDPKKAVVLQGFFKTGEGEYGEGDIFLGVTVPKTRAIAKKFVEISFPELKPSLKSKFHEERLAALLVLVEKFKKGAEKDKKEVFDFYLANRKGVNNWDLVDLSADKIVGEYLLERDKRILFDFAVSSDLWEKRIAIVSTFAFIKRNRFTETLKISELLLNDEHDLIHKAVGWMLREVGKRDQKTEETFLKKHYKKMPRTMLRYAIERFSENKRKAYLKGTV